MTHHPSRRVGRLALFVAAFGACHGAARNSAPQAVIEAPSVSLRIDYAGAEALLAAVQRDSLTDAQVDSLLRIHGVRAIVDNSTRYNPAATPEAFRTHLKAFVRTKTPPAPGTDRDFQVRLIWNNRDQIRSLLSAIKAREADIIARAVAELSRYAPRTGPITITAYLVTGSPSDGFVFDDRPNVFYANLSRAEGDVEGVIGNLAHESYHVMQNAAQRRVPGLEVVANASEKLPPGERLLAITLAEGTANYAIDPLRSTAASPAMEQSRARYRRNAEPRRITENFALFDSVLAGLREGRITWDAAYRVGFSGNNDARFYFVGYEMAKAIDRNCGAPCIVALFERAPAEFFRQYIALYRKHAHITARFSRATEDYIGSLPSPR